jgi:hypothetical protein
MASLRKRFGVILLLATSIIPIANTPTAFAAVGDSDTYLSLDGTSQYGSIAEGSAFIARGVYSVEAWIKPAVTTCSVSGNTYCPIAAHDGDYALFVGDGRLQAFIYYNGIGHAVQVDSGYSLSLNDWQHVALVKNGASVLMYINGFQVSSYTITGYTGPSTYTAGTYPFRVGWLYSGEYFAGGIDDVRLYSTNISSATVQADMKTWGPNNASNLVAYYDFNDGSSSSVTNKVSGSTSATDLTLYASPSLPTIESVTISAQYTTIAFPRTYLTSNGGWKVPNGITTTDLLVVGGGGGGSGGNTNPGVCESGGGGGGGGGQVQTLTNQSLTSGSIINFQVGAGGPPGIGGVSGSVFGKAGNSGLATTFGSTSSAGGGGGGVTTTACKPSPGGTSGNGIYSGGAASGSNYAGGGGGGGNSAVGSAGTATNNSTGGNGGAGSSSPITGLTYGGGGGGGINAYMASLATPNGVAGSGGAGGGGTGNAATIFGSPNTGGGGGGGTGGGGGSGSIGGQGGSGIIVLKFIQRAIVNSFGLAGGVLTATYRVPINLSVSLTQQSRVTFNISGKPIPGCRNLLTTGSGATFTATCSWKPATHTAPSITAVAVPTSGTGTVSSTPIQVQISTRATRR